MYILVLYKMINLFINKRHEKKKTNNLVYYYTSNVSYYFKIIEVFLVLHVNILDNSFLNS